MYTSYLTIYNQRTHIRVARCWVQFPNGATCTGFLYVHCVSGRHWSLRLTTDLYVVPEVKKRIHTSKSRLCQCSSGSIVTSLLAVLLRNSGASAVVSTSFPSPQRQIGYGGRSDSADPWVEGLSSWVKRLGCEGGVEIKNLWICTFIST